MTVKRNNAFIFIFVTLMIDMIGFGIIIPVIPKLIEQLIGGNVSDASEWGAWLMFSFALMQFIFSPILGGLSDRFGRRPVLLISLFGLGVDYIIHGLAPSITWLFIGRIIAGIGGASFTTATAYIADISAPEKRAQNFGMVGAAFGMGFIIGPVIGGLAGDYWGPRAPFYLAAVLTFLNFLYGYFVLPESLPKENRRKFEWKRANPAGSLKNLTKYPIISGLVMSFIFIGLAAHAVQSTWSYYTMHKFDWDEKWVGYSLGFVGLMIGLVQGLLIRVTVPKLGQKKSIFIGLSLYTLGLLLFAFASEGWMMFAILVPYALGGICNPALQGVISSQVPMNAQGELQGGLTGLMSATSIFGPLIMNNLFHYFSADDAQVYFPGAPYLLGAVFMFISILFAARSLAHYHPAKTMEIPVEPTNH